MGVIDSAKRFFKTEPAKESGDTKFTKIENLEQAANYLKAVKDQAKNGDKKIDVTITTASSIESGLAGVFSGYAPQVKQVSEEFGLDPADLWRALGDHKVVAAQESMIREIAIKLALG